MFNIFKSGPLLSDSDRDFQIATFKWLLKYFGGDDFYKNTSLILPTSEFFPAKVGTSQDAAQSIFTQIKKFAGMENWSCTLAQQEQDIDPLVAPTIAIQNAPVSPHGTFQATESDDVVITYNPSLLSKPDQLVATLAHELSHYLTATSPEEPPGGWENWEFVTDITATFLGFGVFMSNSAFTFSQHTSFDSMGWQSSRSGYLSESEHIYALAIFLLLLELPFEKAVSHLKPSLRKVLKNARREIEVEGIIGDLSSVIYKGVTK